MAKRREKRRKKLRTREHVLEDLSINFVERQALECNYAVERHAKDYGLDLLLMTFDDDGDIQKGLEIDSGYVHIQVKATDRVQLLQDNKTVRFSLDASDVLDWDARFHPVIFVLYDATAKRAYWIHVQRYLEENREKIGSGKTITIHLPMSNRLNRTAVRKFRQLLLEVLEQREAS